VTGAAKRPFVSADQRLSQAAKLQGFPYLSFLALLPRFLVPFCILFGLLALAARSSWHECFIIPRRRR
jgi:hypothetical protein